MEEMNSISTYSQVQAIWIRLMLTSFSNELYIIPDKNKKKLKYLKPYYNHFEQLLQILETSIENLENKKLL